MFTRGVGKAVSICIIVSYLINSLTNVSWIVTYRSRIHESTNSLMFLGIILIVLRIEVSVYNFYITNQFQATFARGGGGIR